MIISTFRPSKIHADLGPQFFDAVNPAEFPKHIVRFRNDIWARRVGLAGLSSEEWLAHFGRFEPLEGSFPKPLALRYHGHQFRHYNPDLGDGRGFLFAQLFDDQDRLLDLGTKGSGQTPWSRQGDGRLTLKGGVREVLATAMLEALGVNTSKTFSLIETGESLYRGDEPSPTRSAVMVRLNHSHIRIGTFQRQAYLKEDAALSKLLSHCVTHYYPECRREDEAETAAAFLHAVCANVAQTAAQWIAAGFVHGVLNTDNINITGESFDYGPWRFLPHYDPDFTAAYFDQTGLYAFGRQPDAIAWNLTQLASCLLPLSNQAALEKALNSFWHLFQPALSNAYLDRLGLVPEGAETDLALTQALISFLAETEAPYEQVLFDLHGGAAAKASTAVDHYNSQSFGPLKEALAGYNRLEDRDFDHPYFQNAKPRTMLIDEVEAIWGPIADADDWSALDKALAEIADMGVAYGNMQDG